MNRIKRQFRVLKGEFNKEIGILKKTQAEIKTAKKNLIKPVRKGLQVEQMKEKTESLILKTK